MVLELKNQKSIKSIVNLLRNVTDTKILNQKTGKVFHTRSVIESEIKDLLYYSDKSGNITNLLKYIFSYPYSSLQEYSSSKFKIVNPKSFPVYFKNINEHKKELLEWLNFNNE
ncbi:MAG: hypothetical protein AAB658_14675 [Chloroflexota bacterium]